jgi:hypothetical protein
MNHEISMKKCDVCFIKVEEFSMKFYRESGMMVCQDCRPKFESQREDFEELEQLAEALNLPMMWRDKIEDQFIEANQ